MSQIVVADIGGTNARFAIAEVESGRVRHLHEAVLLKTAAHAGLAEAWAAFGQTWGHPLPKAAAVAVAAPVGDEIKLTNASWSFRPADIRARLAPDGLTLVNDFAALGHAVAQLKPDYLRHVCGPDRPLPQEGAITVVGPGTGLGVGLLLRTRGVASVAPTEGGHIDFAPLDEVEDHILDALRARYGRVSVERIVSGPGLANIHQALATLEDRPLVAVDDSELWAKALGGDDVLARAALERFCLSFGAVAGDLALAHGAVGVALAGGVAARLGERLAASGFHQRFLAKGRYADRMNDLPVRMITHPQPGLFGAAAAFATETAA